MKMRVPKGASHIVDHTQFTDARPTIGAPSATFNPGAGAGPLPSGAPRYVGAPGQRTSNVLGTNKMSNKRM